MDTSNFNHIIYFIINTVIINTEEANINYCYYY